MTLAEIRDNNILLGCLGITFVNPVFRMLTAQLPYEVESYTIYGMDDEKKEKSFRKLLSKKDDPFVLIVRGHNASLEEVLFVPSKTQRQEIRSAAGRHLPNAKTISASSEK